MNELALRINEEYDKLKKDAVTVTNRIVVIGNMLIEAKATVAHGEWMKWVEENMRVDHSTVTRFIKAAKMCAAHNLEGDEILKVAYGRRTVGWEAADAAWHRFTLEDAAIIVTEVIADNTGRSYDDVAKEIVAKELVFGQPVGGELGWYTRSGTRYDPQAKKD